MGIGDAYLGLVDLLSNYGKLNTQIYVAKAHKLPEQCTEPDSIVECLIGFVAETTLQSIKRATDDTIAHWYHAVSQALFLTSAQVLTTISPSTPKSLSRTATTSGTPPANANSAANSAT
jgi:histone deacetylase 6